MSRPLWKRSLLISAALLAQLPCGVSAGQAQTVDQARHWNIADTGQPARDVSFSTTEGTWMSLDISPDGKWIMFDLLGDIYRMPSTGGVATAIQSGPAMQYVPRFSPDGSRIAFISDATGNNNIWVSNADGSDARAVTDDDVNLLMGPDWSPSGDAIAAVRIDSAYPNRWASQILLLPLDKTLKSASGRLLVDTPANRRDVMEPRFSPDGRWLYYTERLNSPNIYIDGNHANYAIRRREFSTGKVEDVAAGYGGAMAAQVSRDGKTLAFVRRVMAKTVLFKLDLATGEQTAVYDALDRDLQASYEVQGNYFPHFSWFPDNRHVAIWGKGKIFKVDMTTGKSAEIPFRAETHHRIIDQVRVRQNLEPATFTVRAIRHLAPSSGQGPLIFSGLGQLWRRAADGAPVKFSPGDAFAFDPRISSDDRSVVYVEWNDQQGSVLKVARSDGREERIVTRLPGVIRQPSLSPDGKNVIFRIQDPDVNMGGARTKAGIYIAPVTGGAPRLVTTGDDAPIFSPDGQRIYFLRTDRSGDSPAQRLWSVNLQGFDAREHARAPDADTTELRISPDLRWIAFKDRQQVHVLPYVETGRPMIVSAGSKEAEVRTLSDIGGFALAWSPDSHMLYWSVGPELYRYDVMSGDTKPAPFASAGLTAKSDVPAGTVAFTNARIITMNGDAVIENGTIVVTANRVTAIGPAGTVAVPAGAKVFDATSKTIMPGIIDAHGHIDCCWHTGAAPKLKPPLYAALAFGVTTVFDPYPNELTSYENTETTRAGISAGPRWIGTGAAVWGRPRQASNLYEPLDSYDQIQRIIARKARLGGTIVKSYRIPNRRERQMLVKAGREGGLMIDAEGESHFYNNISMILDGHTNLEHNLPVQTYYDDIVQLMAAAGMHNTPTLVVTFGELMGENYMYQTTQSWKDPKVRTFVQEVSSGYSPLGTPYGAPPYVRGITTIQAADEIYDIGFRAVARSTKKLDDAGVVINAGSHGEVPGLSQHWEMQLLTEGGMTNARALRAGTINVAKTLGIDDQVGSLEVGKLADLIVLDKNPLEDIKNTNSVRYTMVNGRLYDSATMNEIGNYDRPRPKFYWEIQKGLGVDWNESWVRQ